MLSTGFHEMSMVSCSFSFVLKGVVGLSQLKAWEKKVKKYSAAKKLIDFIVEPHKPSKSML